MIYYTIIDFNEVDIRIYLPEKVIIRQDRKTNLYITFKLKLTKLFYISPQQNLYPPFLLCDFSFKNENFATFTFVVKDMFNLQSKTSKPKDFITSFSNCY